MSVKLKKMKVRNPFSQIIQKLEAMQLAKIDQAQAKSTTKN